MKKTGKNVGWTLGAGGFTLLEVTIAITVAAVLGTIAIQFSGTSLRMSSETVIRIRNGYVLEELMEKITRDYRIWLEENPGMPITGFMAVIRSTPEYRSNVDTTATGTTSVYYVDPANDGDIELLHLTLSDGDQHLVALFTK